MGGQSDQQRLDRINAESLGRALEGFSLVPKCSMGDLAGAIHKALRMSTIMSRDVSWRTSSDFNRRGPKGGPDRQGNAATRRELANLAQRAADLSKRLHERSGEASDVIWKHAFWNRPDEDQEQPSDHQRFLKILPELDWIADFLGEAAEGLKEQAPRWVQSERHEQRVFHAHALSGVFEWAFGRPPTITLWRHRLEGEWPNFFQRMMNLMFDEATTPNLKVVLEEARHRYKDSGPLIDF